MLRRPSRAFIAIMSLGLAGAVWGTCVEPSWLIAREEAVEAEGWHVGPLDVAIVSDLHAGSPHAGVEKMRRVAAALAETKPDLVLLLGDYGINHIPGGSDVDPASWAAFFGAIDAPLGVYAVLGNHDWWGDTPGIRVALEAGGVRVLENAAVPLREGEDRFWLVGVGDTFTGHDRVATAFAGVPPDATVLAMSHGPDVVDVLGDRADLIVAGHTHGGQIFIPFVSARLLGLRWRRGLHHPGGIPLYVTSGIGTSVLPIRLGVPPEVALLHVRERGQVVTITIPTTNPALN